MTQVDRVEPVRQRPGFAQYFEALGPILAGFQLAAVVIGFFGSGALAKWILYNWFPFTRYLWSLVLAYIKLPEVTAAEKDALTTMVFFLPMGLWALYAKFFRKAPTPPLTYKIPALFVGALFVVLLGEQFLSDAYELAKSFKMPPSISLWVDAFGYWQGGLIFLVILVVVPFLGAFYFHMLWRSRNNIINWILDFCFHLAAILANALVLGASVFAAGSLFYFEIGPIRSAAFLLTIVLLLVAVYFNPSRLLVSFGVFLMFVVASLGFEALVWVIGVVQDAPKDFPIPNR